MSSASAARRHSRAAELGDKGQFVVVVEQVDANRMTTSTLTTEGDLVFVASKIADILLQEFQSHFLVADTQVQKALFFHKLAWQAAQRTKSILNSNNHEGFCALLHKQRSVETAVRARYE